MTWSGSIILISILIFASFTLPNNEKLLSTFMAPLFSLAKETVEYLTTYCNLLPIIQGLMLRYIPICLIVDTYYKNLNHSVNKLSVFLFLRNKLLILYRFYQEIQHFALLFNNPGDFMFRISSFCRRWVKKMKKWQKSFLIWRNFW